MEEDIVREIMEEDYKKLKIILGKNDDYFSKEELKTVYNIYHKCLA